MCLEREERSAACWRARVAFDEAKHRGAEEEELRAAATAYVEAVYAYQLAAYGKIRQHLSVASLLR
jgi:hypothetical protein